MRGSSPKRYQCSLPVKFLKSASVNFFLSVMAFPLLLVSVASADATLASPRSGGCKPQAPSRGTGTQRRLRAPSARNGVCVLGGRRLRRAGGAGPPSAKAAAGRKARRRQAAIGRQGSLPYGRDAARPSAPVAKN